MGLALTEKRFGQHGGRIDLRTGAWGDDVLHRNPPGTDDRKKGSTMSDPGRRQPPRLVGFDEVVRSASRVPGCRRQAVAARLLKSTLGSDGSDAMGQFVRPNPMGGLCRISARDLAENLLDNRSGRSYNPITFLFHPRYEMGI
jgi:hypothetical protein